jgi:hypothetical protein
MTMPRWPLAIILCSLCNIAAAAYDVTSSKAADLSGRWALNATLSDDAEKLLAERLAKLTRQRPRVTMDGPRDDSAVVMPLPMFRPPSRDRDEQWRRLLGVTKTLEVRQSGATIEIVSALDARRFEAGSRSQVSMPEGELADSNVGWQGEWFVVDRKVRGGPRVVEKYRWLNKTDQLETETAVSGDHLLAGIKVRRIFDRFMGEVAPPDPAQGPIR